MHKRLHTACCTYRMLSTLRGRMRMAMGWSPASCRRFMAFPDTSSMQCFPCENDSDSEIRVPRLHSPVAGGPAHLVSDLSDRLDAGSIQVVVVLPRLDELVLLDLSFHELSGGHEVIIPAVHLVVSPWSRRVWSANTCT